MTEKELETLGGRLRYARNKLDKTQADVAGIVGRTTTAYGHYERNRNEMQRDIAEKICTFLGISLDWLLTGKGNMDDQSSKELPDWAISLSGDMEILKEKDPSAYNEAMSAIKQLADAHRNADKKLDKLKKKIT